jgi:hypothetical protein
MNFLQSTGARGRSGQLAKGHPQGATCGARAATSSPCVSWERLEVKGLEWRGMGVWGEGDGVKTPDGKRLAVKSGWNRSLLRWPIGKKV